MIVDDIFRKTFYKRWVIDDHQCIMIIVFPHKSSMIIDDHIIDDSINDDHRWLCYRWSSMILNHRWSSMIISTCWSEMAGKFCRQFPMIIDDQRWLNHRQSSMTRSTMINDDNINDDQRLSSMINDDQSFFPKSLLPIIATILIFISSFTCFWVHRELHKDRSLFGPARF